MNSNLSQPHQTLKRVFKIVVILLWFITIILSVELTLQLYQRISEWFNPLIRKLNNQPPWTYSGPPKEDQLQRKRLPILPPEKWNTQRAKFFLRLDNDDRNFFANLYSLYIYIIDSSKNTLISYPPHARDIFKEEELKNVINQLIAKEAETNQQDLSIYYDEYQTQFGTWKKLFIFRHQNNEGSTTHLLWYSVAKEGANSSNDPIWEIPFFEYKKHVQLPDKEFGTNNFGFRDDEVIIPKPKDIYRIICLGGSTTEEGPTQNETYPNLAEQLLNERCAEYVKFDVINAGIPGINLRNIWLRIPDILLMEPDCIILCEGANDITHTLLPIWLNNMPTLKKWLIQSKLCKPLAIPLSLPEQHILISDIQSHSMQYIQKMCAYLSSYQIPLFVMSIPAPSYNKMSITEKVFFNYTTRTWWGGPLLDYRMYQYVLNLFNQQLKSTTHQCGAQYIPLYETFIKESPQCFSDLCHMKMVGIRKKAEVVAEFICKNQQNLLVSQPQP